MIASGLYMTATSMFASERAKPAHSSEDVIPSADTDDKVGRGNPFYQDSMGVCPRVPNFVTPPGIEYVPPPQTAGTDGDSSGPISIWTNTSHHSDAMGMCPRVPDLSAPPGIGHQSSWISSSFYVSPSRRPPDVSAPLGITYVQPECLPDEAPKGNDTIASWL